MSSDLEKIKGTWNDLGSNDPLWAILSDNTKRNKGWEADEFFKTGERDVRRYSDLIERYASVHPPYDCVLDFGSGVGRLTRWWALQARKVYGVDISQSMIDGARRNNPTPDRVEYLVNEQPDLRLFEDNVFDVVATHICLQHMPWTLAASYIREFGRVCRSGGVVAFQLPTRVLRANRAAAVRQFIVEKLPFGLGARYRKWRHGVSTAFDVYCSPLETVEKLVNDAGMELLHKERDSSAGQHIESFIFILRVL